MSNCIIYNMENTSIQNNNTTEWTGNVSYTLNIFQLVTHQRYISIIAVYCVIMCVSVVGNSLVVAVVYRNENKRMRTTTNYFIVNMSCSDLFRTVFNIPLIIARLNSEHNVLVGETLGNILCKLSELLFFLSWCYHSWSISVGFLPSQDVHHCQTCTNSHRNYVVDRDYIHRSLSREKNNSWIPSHQSLY